MRELINQHRQCKTFLSVPADLHIKTKNKGNVKIQRMESDLCHVHTEKGHCILQAVKVTHVRWSMSVI